MASLLVKALSKRYGLVRVLDSIDLRVEDGEFVVLVGPSGCGKSTLLRMVAGLEDVSDGELWIGARLANRLAPQQRNISMVFQSYALFPHMTTRGNIGFGPRMRRDAAGAIDAKVKAAAAILNLHGYLDRFPRQLSGSGSGSRWAVPSCASRTCSCSTSRCPTWTPSCGCRCGPRSRRSISSSGRRSSTSRTTRSRP